MHLNDASELDLFAAISGYNRADIAKVTQALGIEERYMLQPQNYSKITFELIKLDMAAINKAAEKC